MPQMAPISWLTLFFIFSLTFIMFNVMNYFFILYTTNNKGNKKLMKMNYLNWKW